MMYYNTDKKLSFLNTLKTNHDRAVYVLQAVAKLEEKYDKDLAQFTKEEIEAWLNQSCGNKAQAVRSAAAILKRYISWCNENGETTCVDPKCKFSIDTSARLQENMFSSPKHLQRIMDQAFHPIEENTVDCVYRAYLWLVYATMPEKETVDVLVSEVDLENLIVEHNGRSYEIYREALPVFRQLVQHQDIRIRTGKNLLPKANTDFLLRTVRAAHPEAISVRNVAIKKLDAIGVKTGYKSVRWSGIFYQIYESERAGYNDGIEVWGTRLTLEIDGGESKDERSFILSKRRMKSTIKRDYEMWKKAFE